VPSKENPWPISAHLLSILTRWFVGALRRQTVNDDPAGSAVWGIEI
jgi:hypothetical protein